MKKENWEKEFDRRFVGIPEEDSSIDLSGYFGSADEARDFAIKDFIRQLLRREREKLLEKIKLKKVKDPQTQFQLGYYWAQKDLEKLKNQLKDEK
jgi:hypothetical protein